MNRTELYEYVVARQNFLRGNNELGWHFPIAQAGDNFVDHALATACTVFARHLYSKAKAAQEKYQFPELGWATPNWLEELKAGILEHLYKGDPRDVAIYAMFAWFHGWAVKPLALDVEIMARNAANSIPQLSVHDPNAAMGRSYFLHGFEMGFLSATPPAPVATGGASEARGEAQTTIFLVGDLEDALGKWGEGLISRIKDAKTIYEKDYAGGSDSFLHEDTVTHTVARECNHLIDNLRKLAATEAAPEAAPLGEQKNTTQSWTLLADRKPEPGRWEVAVHTDNGDEVHTLEFTSRGHWLHEGEETFAHGYYFSPYAWRRLPKPPVDPNTDAAEE